MKIGCLYDWNPKPKYDFPSTIRYWPQIISKIETNSCCTPLSSLLRKFEHTRRSDGGMWIILLSQLVLSWLLTSEVQPDQQRTRATQQKIFYVPEDSIGRRDREHEDAVCDDNNLATKTNERHFVLVELSGKMRSAVIKEAIVIADALWPNKVSFVLFWLKLGPFEIVLVDSTMIDVFEGEGMFSSCRRNLFILQMPYDFFWRRIGRHGVDSKLEHCRQPRQCWDTGFSTKRRDLNKLDRRPR